MQDFLRPKLVTEIYLIPLQSIGHGESEGQPRSHG